MVNLKNQKDTISSRMLESMSLDELKEMSLMSGEVEELTPEEEKERWDAICEMATFKNRTIYQ